MSAQLRLTERQRKAMERLKGIYPDNQFFWDEEMRIPKFIKGKLSRPSSEDPETIARKFLDENRDLLDMQEGLEERLKLSYKETDKQGFHHLYFYQTLNGLPVFEGSTQVHINPQGEVVAYKDYRISRIDISLEPKMTKESAIETIIKDINKDTTKTKTNARLSLFRDDEKRLHLAWEVELISDDELGGRYYFIDAHTGKVLYKFTEIRGALSRMTYTANNRNILPGDLIIKDEQTTSDKVAQSAHDHAATVYEYYKDTFGRDSYDNQGAALISTVHYRENYNNAFWSDWYKQMVYGDGDGIRWRPLSFALDIVAHELTHAVNSNTARFVYAEEAGALDESFADFFAVMISNDDPITDWEMGEGVYTPYRPGDAIRDLSNPTKYGQPDHMDNYIHLSPGELPDPYKNDNGYVHYNSGIPNKVAYLIVKGGTHYGIRVKGIGRDKAEQIYYLALTSYLSSSTRSRWTFKQARYAMLNACRQLYGDTGDEYAAIKNAWAAVGIGEPAEDFIVIQKGVSPNMPIPDIDPTGIQSSINVSEQGLLNDISVSVNINHTYIGDLTVTLISPLGESVILHHREGGHNKDIIKTYDLDSTPALRTFIGDQIQGDWILQVADHARIDTGFLRRWEVKLVVQKAEKKRLKKEIFPHLQIPDNDYSGVESLINVDESGKIVNLDISVDITHTWIGDLKVILIMPSGDESILHNRTGYSRNDIKKIYSTKVDESLQKMIGKEIKGDWKLKIIDLASEDIGTLNRWGIEVTYE
jgi:Zn-dependent metalloprotease/subtilisin-like proprotein convertase family protein